MRRAQGKELGYIIVPVVIPPGVDAERHLAVSDKHEGWRELGDILQALRAHDQRIEDALPEVLTIQIPAEQPPMLELKTVVAVGRPDRKNLEYAVVTGSRDDAEDIARVAVKQERPLLEFDSAEKFDETLWAELSDQPTSMIVHVELPDGSTETREDAVVRHKPKPRQERGDVNARQTRRRAGKVANGERGRSLSDPVERARQSAEREQKRQEREAERTRQFEAHIQGVLVDLSDQMGGAIAMNLLEKSGLTGNKVQRDLNLLRGAVTEAARVIHDESGLAAVLDEHFGHDRLSAPKQGKPRADGATVASLLWMNAAMLHQRVHAGGWLGRRGIEPLAAIKASPEPDELFRESWNAITRQDFLPVLEPALEALAAARRTSRLGGLRRALRRIAEEAELIAETYADMGTDHAGALFNEVMGDQSSDGAFFTRPVAADIAARLALEAVDPDNTRDWSDPDVWRANKTVDLACGSGTLLTAVMTEMKRRARQHGADDTRLAELQKVAVEEVLKGLDINPVSLQLAATQLMSGNADVKYRRMGLHQMPYGPQSDGTVAAGTPELFARREIVDSGRLFDDAVDSTTIRSGYENQDAQQHPCEESGLEGPEMDDAVEAVHDARIVIMNPPFTNRTKMGEKFDRRTQEALRRRVDTLEDLLVASDRRLNAVLDKNSIEPVFSTLAQCCLSGQPDAAIALVAPTIKATASSNEAIRLLMAERFHVDTILTFHGASDINLSQNTNISESIFVFRRGSPRDKRPTKIVSLNRFPRGEADTAALFARIRDAGVGLLPDGWGEVSECPAERIRSGDWSDAAWRSPRLTRGVYSHTQDENLITLEQNDIYQSGRRISEFCEEAEPDDADRFALLHSKGASGQATIRATPDRYYKPRDSASERCMRGVNNLKARAAHLLVTDGQDSTAARLVAVASDTKHVGVGWMPVRGLSPQEAKAVAVFLNSTAGRVQLMSNAGRKLAYPTYRPAAYANIRIPDIKSTAVRDLLADCWERTNGTIVPQFSEGYDDVRRRWDETVCEALGWDIGEIAELGELLAREPRVRGVAYGQWKA
ncbi:MAG: hypothetical protein F4064_07835 [Acidimicrobiales bacterium]|nr:hypothetical protein [Acidimicrobiales bacterium]